MKNAILLLSWFFIIFIIIYFWNIEVSSLFKKKTPDVYTEHRSILTSMEAIGKLELTRYNFRDVVEFKELSPQILNRFNILPDAKAVLITSGEAAGCIDLTKIIREDITIEGDTVIIALPEAELCYHKLDLQNTKIYSLETYFTDREEFVEKAFRDAEAHIEKLAMDSEILEQTNHNARLILKPFLENISSKIVFFENPIKEQVKKLE